MSNIKIISKYKNVTLHNETHSKITEIANLENRKINNQIAEIVDYYIKHKNITLNGANYDVLILKGTQK